MKNIPSIASLLILLLILGCKDTSNPSEQKQQEEKMELPDASKSQVEDAIKSFNEALVNPTVEKLNALCDDNLSYGHSSGLIENKEAFVNDVVNGAFDFLTVDSPEQSIILSGETAIVRNLFVAKGIKNSEEINVKLGCVLAFKRHKDGSWKLLMRQAYKI